MRSLILPRLGQTMTEGTITAWLLVEGDSFEIGDPLYEVETDKVSTDVEATTSGRLARILVPSGEVVAVGTVVGVAIEVGETATADDVEQFVQSSIAGGAGVRLPVGHAGGAADGGDPGRDDRQERVVAMPAARQRARELNLDVASLRGTGRNGAVTLADVEAAAGHATSSRDDGRDEARDSRVLTPRMRRMAENVTASWREIPQFHQTVRIDATALLRLKNERSDPGRGDARVTVTALVIHAVVKAVAVVAEANATFLGDAIRAHRDVNVGIAVDTEQGLVVPVLKQVESMDLPTIAKELQDLSERARAAALTHDDVTDATITVSNLGMYGIESGAALVPDSQSAIVFVGAIQDEVLAVHGAAAVRPTFRVTCAFDHRVLDGATAGRFTSVLKDHLEGL